MATFRRAALYVRVSTSDQGQTVENRLQPLQEAAGRLGGTVVAIYRRGRQWCQVARQAAWAGCSVEGGRSARVRRRGSMVGLPVRQIIERSGRAAVDSNGLVVVNGWDSRLWSPATGSPCSPGSDKGWSDTPQFGTPTGTVKFCFARSKGHQVWPQYIVAVGSIG